jgi:hypothetical protein
MGWDGADAGMDAVASRKMMGEGRKGLALGRVDPKRQVGVGALELWLLLEFDVKLESRKVGAGPYSTK